MPAPVQLAVRTRHLQLQCRYCLGEQVLGKQENGEGLGSSSPRAAQQHRGRCGWEAAGHPSDYLRGRQVVGVHLTQLPLSFLPGSLNFRTLSYSPGCSFTPESLNFLKALSFAAGATGCARETELSRESAFGVCTPTSMWERIWRSKRVSVFKRRAVSPRATGEERFPENCLSWGPGCMFLGPQQEQSNF